jgi:SAM-dependent methyltransferase
LADWTETARLPRSGSKTSTCHNPDVVDPRVQDGASADTETERIRNVFAKRDHQGARHGSIVDAYRRINTDRLAKTRSLFEHLYPERRPTILDVGCGAGHDLEFWLSSGWQAERLAGIDLVEERVQSARTRCPGADIRLGSGTALPFETASFDVVTAVTVLSSILDERARQELFDQMRRVAKPGGHIVVYDFVIRKPGNKNVIGMTLDRLRSLGGPPDWTVRITPLLQLVAIGIRLGSCGARWAMRLAPRTHRLTYWRVPSVADRTDS